jgi:hypothetical protein
VWHEIGLAFGNKITESRVESDEKDIWTISFGGRRVLWCSCPSGSNLRDSVFGRIFPYGGGKVVIDFSV